MRGHGKGNLISILLLSPWQGAVRHWEGALYVAGRACGITSKGTGVREGGGMGGVLRRGPEGWEQGSRWLMGGREGHCLPRKAEPSHLQAGTDSIDL